MAELDRRVGNEGLDVVLAELRIEPEHVTGVRLLGGELADGPALGVVGVQELRIRGAVEDERQLPGEVVGVRDPGVPAEPAGRRHVVRSVPGEEDPAVLESLRPLGAGVPLLDVLDLERKVGRPERLAHVPGAPLVAHVRPDVTVAGAVGMSDRVDDEEAGVSRQREAEEALERRPEDVDDAQIPLAQKRLDVGAEVDRDAVGEAGVTAKRDAEPLAHRALAPVRCDDVLRAYAPLLPALALPDDGGHTVVVLVERDQLGGVLESSAELGCVVAEDRLEPDLGDEQAR